MTLQPSPSDPRFEFDRGDRMRRALRVSGLRVEEMAAHLEVSRNTVSNWINGRANPRDRDLKQFALRTGFPIDWLANGTVAGNKGPGGTNGQPLDYRSEASVTNISAWTASRTQSSSSQRIEA